jgi:hypothetical protein
LIAAVHAVVGAAIGRCTGNRVAAFGIGVLSHLICDLLPHRDLNPKVEAPLLAATLGAIAATSGVDSPEVAGAVGAICPDFQNAAAVTGLLPRERMVFPSHQGDHSHGLKIDTVLPQVALAAACLAVVFWPRHRR